MKFDRENVLLMVAGAALMGLVLAFQGPLVLAGHWFFHVALSVHLPLLPF
ncbi:hypothetical protein [Ktedonobacter robiniae]|uniref:Uncharacterized protein n=1 Tax=Ktedonobacter robiniae TaxID=2778365 RepID=A0ABQ3UHH4_9CHLR|nr:hypothetical protein [Ktedonobacter robiniae]GHO52181.1 hypothetical protein KSB_06560 [Ktedonobacter robiniae]